MDMADIDREIDSIQIPKKQGKRIDLAVKNAKLKVYILKALAVLLLVAMGVFGYYTVINAKSTGMDSKIVLVMAFIYVLLGAYVSIKLWHLEFIGWLTLTLVALAGITLPLLSAFNHGLMIGTIPIIAISIVTLILTWYTSGVFKIKKIGDIFRPH